MTGRAVPDVVFAGHAVHGGRSEVTLLPCRMPFGAGRWWRRVAASSLAAAVGLALTPSCKVGDPIGDDPCLRAGGTCFLVGCPGGYVANPRIACGGGLGAGACCFVGKCADLGGVCIAYGVVCPSGSGEGVLGCGDDICCLAGDAGAGDAALHDAGSEVASD